MEKATWTKMRDGNWGLRVEGDVKAGDVVLACTKSGKKTRESVGSVVWAGNGISLCTLGEKPAAKVKVVKKVAHTCSEECDGEHDDPYAAERQALSNAESNDLPY
jgi:hypothetical protein